MTLRKEASSSPLLSASAEDNPQDIHEPHPLARGCGS